MYQHGYTLTVPPMVSVYTQGIGWVTEGHAAATPVSTAWESTDLAVYYPIVLPAPCVIRRVWWANGATTTGGATIEVGVYASSGYAPSAKLVSGSATQGTASEVQFVDVTDTTIGPGLYWIAITSSSGTNTTLFRSSSSAAFDAIERFSQASAQPLPAAATPAETSGSAIWLCGFATTASP